MIDREKLKQVERRRDLALAEARHAYDYGTRHEFEAAQRAARVAQAQLNEAAMRLHAGVDMARTPRLELEACIRVAARRSLEEGWPSYGPEPDRWNWRPS
jgi:hypothetical protein